MFVVFVIPLTILVNLKELYVIFHVFVEVVLHKIKIFTKGRATLFGSFSTFNPQKNGIYSKFKAQFTKENVIAGFIGTGMGLFNVVAINYMLRDVKKPKQKLIINSEDYVYHSIGGFDLFKLVSIINNGILSKSSAEKKGIILSSNGESYNPKFPKN
ncbi:MAG: hypothetical protein H0U75_12990 [Legionella sp.]|nr:hypothetical protein [Legionella sp.]